MFRALAVIAAFALLVYALADFANSDERDRGGIPGWLWIVLIVLLPYFGPLAWISFSRSRRRHGAGSTFPSASGTPKPSRRPSGPIAPDDDPEFLWRLAREQQRQGRTGAAGTPDAASGSSTPWTDGQAPSGHGASDQAEQGQAGQGQSGTGQSGQAGQSQSGQGQSGQGQSGQSQSGQSQSGQGPHKRGPHDSTSRDQAPRSGPQDDQSPDATSDS